MKHSILIAGPTASGKSAFSLMLAEKLNGVVINSDSMQVYRDLRVLTARPSIEEEQSVPHKLYGYMDASEAGSAAEWRDKAIVAIREAQKQGRVPIVVGGTGMYFRFLLEGVAPIPDIDPEIRCAVRRECDVKGPETLHQHLKDYDPILFERLHATDSQRICRAVEVYRSTGKALSLWQTENDPGPLYSDDQLGMVHKYIIDIDREILYQRCNKRFDLMMTQGALEEVKNLMTRALDSTLPCLKSLGYPELIRAINGEISYEEAIETAKMQTRRFAKRQLTWFRNQFKHWTLVNPNGLEIECYRLVKHIFNKEFD